MLYSPVTQTGLNVVPGVFARQSNLPILQQRKRIRHKEHGQAPQKSTRPANPQVMKHSRRKQREPGTERRSHEIVSGQHRGSILGVGMGLVAEDAVEDETAADSEEHGGDNGHDSKHAGQVARPAEPEQREGQAKHPAAPPAGYSRSRETGDSGRGAVIGDMLIVLHRTIYPYNSYSIFTSRVCQ